MHIYFAMSHYLFWNRLLCICRNPSADSKTANTSKLQSSDFGLENELYKTSSGNAKYQIKTLSGILMSAFEPFKNLAGKELKFDYKFNSLQKKLEANYDLALDKNNYKGKLFIDNNKLIMSTELLSLIKEFDPSFNFGRRGDLPQYLYFSDKNLVNMWGKLVRGQNVSPEFRDFIVFIIEAVPDKYFNVSLVNQKAAFSIDQSGLEDVVFSIIHKINNEKERFATLVANFTVASDPTQNFEKIKGEILRDLEKSESNGGFLDNNPEGLKKLLAGMVALKELNYEASLLPSGQNRLIADFDFGGDSKLAGKIRVDTNFSGSKENLNGKYTLNLTVKENIQRIKVDGQINGEFQQTAIEAKYNGLTRINVTDFTGTNTLLDFALQANSEARVDQNIQVNTPALTESNSMNIEKYLKNTPEVLIDGKPVVFDVDPFIVNLKGGKRILVPLRNLVEALGCEVRWIEPDQINIYQDDMVISMYINKQSYMVNGIEKQLDVAPFIKDGKITMVPLRFIAEELGCTVEYDAASNTVFIYTK